MFENIAGFKKYASVFTWLVAVVPAASFIFSVFFDWGLFSVIGISFSAAPTSIADHFRTSLVWLPYVIIGGSLIGTVFLIIRSVNPKERGNETPDLEPASLPEDKRDLVAMSLGILSILLWVFSWLFLGSVRIPMGVPASVLTVSFSFCVWILLNKTLNEIYDQRKLRLLALTPTILAGFFGLGYATGLQALENSDPKHRITVENENVNTTMNVEIVRSIGEWMVVVPKPDSIDFVWIRMDKIVQIEILDKGRFPGLGCLFFRALCTAKS